VQKPPDCKKWSDFNSVRELISHLTAIQHKKNSAYCSESWVLTDLFFDYLTEIRGFRKEAVHNLPQSPEYFAAPRDIRPGDVVFYHQEDADYKGRFNHVAIIVDWGPLTKYGEPVEYRAVVPHVADRSNDFISNKIPGINDTGFPVQKLVIVYIR